VLIFICERKIKVEIITEIFFELDIILIIISEIIIRIIVVDRSRVMEEDISMLVFL
jgi:hypothetical protein